MVSLDDVFHSRLPLTSNCAVIIFIPGLLRSGTNFQTVRGRKSVNNGWAKTRGTGTREIGTGLRLPDCSAGILRMGKWWPRQTVRRERLDTGYSDRGGR